MGLDIAFNMNEASLNGATLSRFEEEVPDYNSPDPEATKPWISYGFALPEREGCQSCSIADDTVHVRANQWGEFYAPLMEFLDAHNIEHYEY